MLRDSISFVETVQQLRATSRSRIPNPGPDNPVAFITNGLQQCQGESWRNWRTVLKAAYGEPLDADELAFFREVAQRDPPPKRVRELWLVVGRRGGKDSIASLIAVEAARHSMATAELRPGERPIVACLAADRDQAGIVFGYIKGYFETNPELMNWVIDGKLPRSHRAGPISLKNGIDIQVVTNTYRAPRGHAIACVILDEVSFWRSEDSANPDIETYRAIRPGMASIPTAMLVGISTAYRKAGLLYQKYDEFFGKDDPDTLVIRAPTRAFNPRVDQLLPGEIDKALAEDPIAANAEYFSIFRDDLADYVDPDVVKQCTVGERYEIPYQRGTSYTAFVDPSGGSSDSFTLAIAHCEVRGRNRWGILDCLREVRAPLSPERASAEFVDVLRSYRITRVIGDAYGGEGTAERFKMRGIAYKLSELHKSDIYFEFLPHLNSRHVELLDHPRLFNQLCGLERRSIRGGRDKIDHKQGAHDDVVNVAAGALLHAINNSSRMVISDELLEKVRRRPGQPPLTIEPHWR